MAKVRANIRVKASSLVEVTVAMVILIMVFGMALAAYIRVTSSGLTLKRLKYGMMASEHAASAIEKQQLLDDKVALPDGALLQRTINPYNGNSSLLQVDVYITGPAGDTLGLHRELVYVAEEN